MRVLFIGMGSIGRRHARNLATVLHEKGESFSFAALRSRNNPLMNDIAALVGEEYFSWEEIKGHFDAIFITNPTSLHYETLMRVQGLSHRVFIEKPVFSQETLPQDEMKLSSSSIHYVAAPLRYTRVFRYLREHFSKEKAPVQAARAICSSYLPDWRPGTDYRMCHSAHKEMGGDVGVELIHEWDYLTLMFGMPSSVKCLSRKVSAIETTSDDIALYLAEYQNMAVSLWLDYFGRTPRREVELYLPDEVVVGDFIAHEIRFLSSGRRIALPEDRDDFQKEELRYFLSLASDSENENTISHAVEVMKLAKGMLL